jgi:hypothetical protein
MNTRKIRDIEYEIIPGTERKTTDIVIERNGAVTVHPPKTSLRNRWMRWLKANACGYIEIWPNGGI